VLAQSTSSPKISGRGLSHNRLTNHHQRRVLHAIFAHPVNANLDLKDVTNVLTGLGAEIDAKAKSRIGVTLNGRSAILHLTNHRLLKAEVMQIRKFLESCGIAAEAFPV
jgi:hypothetical protein